MCFGSSMETVQVLSRIWDGACAVSPSALTRIQSNFVGVIWRFAPPSMGLLDEDRPFMQ